MNNNNKNEIIKQFRNKFQLSEEDHSDEKLLNALEKNSKDFNSAIDSLFD